MKDFSSFTKVSFFDKVNASLEILGRMHQKCSSPVIAFSGGKDAIVVAHLSKVLDAVMDVSFTFARARECYKRSVAQLGLNCSMTYTLTDEWLMKNPQWIFSSPKKHGQFFGMRQQRTVKRFAKQRGKDCIIYGRRLQENTVPSDLYRTMDGMLHCHPLRDWTQDEIWSFIDAHDLEFPDIYNHEIGQRGGNCPWVTMTHERHEGKNLWGLIQDYDEETFHQTAKYRERI